MDKPDATLDKRLLLAQMLKKKTEVSEFPLSFAQQRLWFLDQLIPNNPFYNVPGAFLFRGNLDLEALTRCINTIVRRHETLRTIFTKLNSGETVQNILPNLILEIPLTDLRHLGARKAESEAHKLATEEAQRPFDLTRGPLLRVRLLRLDNNEHVMVFNMHHIISDGWSLGIFIKEIAALYSSFISGDPSPLKSLPLQYADFAQRQREWWKGAVLEKQLAYWKRQLAGLPEVLAIPTDHPYTVKRHYRGAHFPVNVSSNIANGLSALGSEVDATMFMTLLTAFQVLLFRYTGQNDFAIGSPIANRNWADVEGLIGFFVNTLVLRGDLSGDPTFMDLLSATKETALGAYANQDTPFERLVEELQPKRAMSHQPLVQVMLALQNVPIEPIELHNLEMIPWEFDAGIVRFDLEMHLWEKDDGGLWGSILYTTDLFEESTIKRMVGHFQNLLESIIFNPHQRISELNLLSVEEYDQLRLDFNATEALYPKVQIQQLFEQQVKNTPDAEALIFENESLTYADLNTRTNQLACHLQELGVGSDVLVGICLERSFELIISVLSILKAGGVIVPIDPNYPNERLNFMFEDAQLSVLITKSEIIEKLPSNSAKQVCLDKKWNIHNHSGENNTVNIVQPEHLFYVIFTSGSTGRPKGVSMNHAAILNLLEWQHRNLKIPEGSRTLQFASLSFDVSFQEILSTLCYGGTLVMISDENRRDMHTLTNFINEKNIFRLFLPFVALDQLASTMVEESFTGQIKQVITAGEQLKISQPIRQLLDQQTIGNLYNQYGPSETHVVTQYTAPGTTETWSDLPPIGKPIANNRVYILDSELNMVPVGVPGEMYLGGINLARGYYFRPGLTAEKFIPDPFSRIPGERLYRTGDLVRYLSNGNIEFIGRIDHQVKIRGFRIELGEIETIIIQHPSIKEVVVAVSDSEKGPKSLTAYLVPINEELNADMVRAFLKSKLPEYMIPSAFVFLEALPLNPNGKVDRKALPEPDKGQRNEEYIAPRNKTEEVLAQLWGLVLSYEKVGVKDNFFESGGHSLLATQLISKIRTSFQVDIPLHDIFEFPVLADLAQVIDKAKQDQSGITIPAIIPVDRSNDIPLSFAQQRLWFLDQLESENPFYIIPVVIRLEGQLDKSVLMDSINEIISRHEALRTNFKATSGTPTQHISEKLELSLSVTDLSDLAKVEQAERIRKLTVKEAKTPFDLSKDALLRVNLLTMGDNEYVLMVMMHHIVSDGWSISVFLKEIEALYRAFIKGLPSPLPPLPIQYADFAHWQRQWMNGEVLQNQLDYWSKNLKGAPTLLNLPTNRPRPPMQRYHGTTMHFELSVETTAGLKKISNQAQSTLFMTLCAAFNILLSRYSGQNDICIGTPVANRNRSEIEPLISVFFNTLVLRSQIDSTKRFDELLRQVRSTALDAFTNQDVPFELVVDAVLKDRDLSYTPIFQAMLILQNVPREALQLPNLKLHAMHVDTGTSKFDLTVEMTESSNQLFGIIEYSTDLFDTSFIEQIRDHFIALLDEVSKNPRRVIRDIKMISNREKVQLLETWNNTTVPFSKDRTIHEEFEIQVNKTPNAIAIEYGEHLLTYDELNNKANQLAYYLRSQGVGPNTFVGVCIERSQYTMIALLGILKAGGAFVPMDPNYPLERLEYMLNDASPAVLLTQKHLLEHIPDTNIPNRCLEDLWLELKSYSTNNLNNSSDTQNLAYVIYTSGSTGRPKGVMLKHSGLVNLMYTMREELRINSQDVLLSVTSLSFDLVIPDLFLPIFLGARTVFCSSDTGSDPQKLTSIMETKKVSVMQATPSTWRMLAEYDNWPKNTQLLKAVCGGEALPAQLAKKLLDRMPAFWNFYGPTEATVWSCANHIKASKNDFSIGNPIANNKIYILDGDLNLLPVGISGELYIGGDGLAVGYLNRRNLTAEKFVPNPFSDKPGERLYKTGDLARYLPNGNIEFLGRIDHQVKIRGFRIELGEITTTLTRYKAVKNAVVVTHGGELENNRLVAYVVMDSKEEENVGKLRSFLKDKLPEYMVPAIYIFMDALPLSPNGKVDRKKLPAPENLGGVENMGILLPRDTIELKLIQIWKEVLKVSEIGVKDNFFDLGGHSLAAVKLMAEVQREFGKQLPLSNLFTAPTIEKLSGVIREQVNTENWSPIVNIQPKGSLQPFFCVPGGGANVIYFHELAHHLGTDQPFYGLQPKGLDGNSQPFNKLEDLAAYYVDAMQKVQPAGPYLLGGHSFGGKVAFEMTRQLLDKGEEVKHLIILDTLLHKPASHFYNWDDTQWMILILRLAERFSGSELNISYDDLKNIEYEEQFEYISKQAQLSGLLPPGSDTRQIRGLLQVYKSHLQMSYMPTDIILPTPITLYRAEEVSSEDDEMLSEYSKEILDKPDWGWGQFTEYTVQVKYVPGDHFTMLTDPHVQVLAKHITDNFKKYS